MSRSLRSAIVVCIVALVVAAGPGQPASAASVLTLTTSSGSMGALPLGDTATKVFRLTNTAGVAMPLISTQVVNDQPGNTFSLDPSTTCGSVVGARATCSITVIERPTTVGALTGSLKVTDTIEVQINGLFVMALTLARFTKKPVQGPTARYYQHIVRFSASFAFAVDVAMLTLGGYLKKKEGLSARLGDVLSCMYLASMVLKHHENQGKPEADLPIVEWACRDLLYAAQEQLHGFLRNFPNAFLAGVMRALIFPRGLTYSAPGDRLGRQLAELVTMPSESRDRLCESVYRTLEPGNALGLLQEALVLSQTAEPLEKRLRVEGVKTGRITALDLPGQVQQGLALGILSETEAAQLRDYDRKVMHLINVDDFAPHELGVQAQPGRDARAADLRSA